VNAHGITSDYTFAESVISFRLVRPKNLKKMRDPMNGIQQETQQEQSEMIEDDENRNNIDQMMKKAPKADTENQVMEFPNDNDNGSGINKRESNKTGNGSDRKLVVNNLDIDNLDAQNIIKGKLGNSDESVRNKPLSRKQSIASRMSVNSNKSFKSCQSFKSCEDNKSNNGENDKSDNSDHGSSDDDNHTDNDKDDNDIDIDNDEDVEEEKDEEILIAADPAEYVETILCSRDGLDPYSTRGEDGMNLLFTRSLYSTVRGTKTV
jgi:hypothetical protein